MKKMNPRTIRAEESINVRKVHTREELETVFDIRQKVFVEEQNVAKEEEYDEFEKTSSHFLATCMGTPAGTARWRFTDYGIKLERFAVLKPYRGRGIAKALVASVLKDIASQENAQGKTRYLHAQLAAIPLYGHFGFLREGELFMECGIPHYKMKIPLT